MPSRNQKKISKQGAEYLQTQDENKAKARALYKANSKKRRPLYATASTLISMATATRPIPKRSPLESVRDSLVRTSNGEEDVPAPAGEEGAGEDKLYTIIGTCGSRDNIYYLWFRK